MSKALKRFDEFLEKRNFKDNPNLEDFQSLLLYDQEFNNENSYFDENKLSKIKFFIESAEFFIEKYKTRKSIDKDKFVKKTKDPLQKALDLLEDNWELFDEVLHNNAYSSLKLLLSQIEKDRLNSKALDKKRGVIRISKNHILYLLAEELLIYFLGIDSFKTAEIEYIRQVNAFIEYIFGNGKKKPNYFRFSSKYKIFQLVEIENPTQNYLLKYSNSYELKIRYLLNPTKETINKHTENAILDNEVT